MNAIVWSAAMQLGGQVRCNWRRRQSPDSLGRPDEPHQLDAALRFTFEAATRLGPVEVTVDVDLQQDGRVVRRAASFGGNHATDAQQTKIEFIDKHIDYSHRIGVRDVIIQALGQQCALTSVLALDVTLHGL